MSESAADDLRKMMQNSSEPEVYRILESGPERLSNEQAEKKLAHYGRNAISRINENRLSVFAANFTHLMALLLWAGGLIAIHGSLCVWIAVVQLVIMHLLQKMTFSYEGFYWTKYI